MIAVSVKNKVILEMPDRTKIYRLERKQSNGEWLVLTASGFAQPEGAAPAQITDSYLDTELQNGLYQYRAREFDQPDSQYDYSMWVRCGEIGPIGYTFGNYQVPEGRWGQIVTADDLRYTFLWGVDFKASNGESFTDPQIEYQIDVALKQIERQLNITLKRTRIKCDPDRRGLQKGVDYDEEENYYTYSRAKIQRNGLIDLRKRPVLSVSRLDLMSRHNSAYSLLDAYTLDKTKGRITFFNRPPRVDDSYRAVQVAAYPYGADIKQYQDEIEQYIHDNKMKFAHLAMGAL